jgi:plasmid stabilization system protein ParE
MANVIWTRKALGQLERAIKYIHKEQGTSYAQTVLSKILKITERLETTPFIGTKEPLLAHKKYEYRFVLAWSYKIIYRASKENVVISRVFHTSRNPSLLKSI